MESTVNIPVEYCLYARKSTEDDERQAMSIDSQIKEMTEMAVKGGLCIKEIREEKHSAKMSGKRPIFNQLLNDIRGGMFTGILTWAPDRLSRNAGDLGVLVDLMDQGKLTNIKTFTQAFTNSPSDKFLLMILCSQAKLENDQKGINVKRGIRAKCQMGWRPGVPPTGYFNRTMNGVKDIVPDPQRAIFITKMFDKVANGESGWDIKRWFDESGMTSRSGKKIYLGNIYLMLKNPFYFGEFEYPIGSGNWYLGKHKPLTTKLIYEKAQIKLATYPKARWGSKVAPFKGLFKCGACGNRLIGEEKIRKRKWGDPVRHVYYHCARNLTDCSEPYISEEKLIKQILRYINFMNIAHPDRLKLSNKLREKSETFYSIRSEILYEQDIDPNCQKFDPVNFSKFILNNGSIEEKRDLIVALGKQIYIKNKYLISSIDK